METECAFQTFKIKCKQNEQKVSLKILGINGFFTNLKGYIFELHFICSRQSD